MKVHRLVASALAGVLGAFLLTAELVEAAPASSLMQAAPSVRALASDAPAAEKAYYYRRYYRRPYYGRRYYRRPYYRRYYRPRYYRPYYYRPRYYRPFYRPYYRRYHPFYY